jgi:hypothetical protein
MQQLSIKFVCKWQESYKKYGIMLNHSVKYLHIYKISVKFSTTITL